MDSAYHDGCGSLVPKLHQNTKRIQFILSDQLPIISNSLSRTLKSLGIPNISRQTKILGFEWTALIGHMGHLNTHLIMQKLGWWDGSPIILTSPDKIANRDFLNLLSNNCPVLILGENISPYDWHELSRLRPHLAQSHQGFQNKAGQSFHWNDIGAKATKAWDDIHITPPLREIYDQSVRDSDDLNERFSTFKKTFGMSDSDWYVCLHLRDSNTRDQTQDAGESVRNMNFINYLDAVKFITDLGGWVVRMGSPKTENIPNLERVIDYAHYKNQHPSMDIKLVRNARMFIGTTSGFAYVASAFGIPCAMVNCISSVGLLWSKNTKFSLKSIFTKSGKFLSQSEIISNKWRWSFPTHEAMDLNGLRAFENTATEITETVKEVFDLVHGTNYSSVEHNQNLLELWEKSLHHTNFYGSAVPSNFYLKSHYHSFLRDVS